MAYVGGKKLMVVCLQIPKRQYEVLGMKKESLVEYFTKVITLTNNMKNYGETFIHQAIEEKVLRSLTPRFYHIVVAIE